jgi:hypothetical protein
MIRITLLLSLICGLFFEVRLSAQARQQELMKELIELKPFKKMTASFEFKAGEEIIFSFETTNGRKINRVEILEPNGSSMNMTARKKRSVKAKRIRVYEPGFYTFKFRNRSIRGSSLNVKIEKGLRMMPKDTMVLDDIIFTSRIDTLSDLMLDTLAYPDVSSYEFTLAPGKDMRLPQDTCMEDPLIEGEKNQFVVYWVGIGDSAMARYNALKANPPLSWGFKNVNEPVVAYAMGLTKTLPVAPNSLANDVIFRFQNPEQESKTLKPTDQRSPFFDVIPANKAGKYKNLKMCVRNFNTSTGVKVYVRIAKFKIDTKKTPKLIVRERIQEVYIKSQYDVIDTREE